MLPCHFWNFSQIAKEPPSSQPPSSPTQDESFAWKRKHFEEQMDTTEKEPTSAFSYQPPPQVNGPTLGPGPLTNGMGQHASKSLLHMKDEPSRLPPSQSPFITLLQKNRGELNMVEVLDRNCNMLKKLDIPLKYTP